MTKFWDSVRRWISRRCARLLRAQGFSVSENRYSESYLNKYDFRIETLVDIGVYEGSSVFYKLFNDAKIALIDPIPDLERRIQRWLDSSSYDIEIIPFAAGASEGSMELLLADQYTGLLPRLDGSGKPTGRRQVRVAPLDTLLSEKKIKGPFGIKIDTEGFEYSVIQGAKETLKITEFVFAEVNIRERFSGSYTFSEFVALMAANGFEVADVISHQAHNRYADVLFVRADSPKLKAKSVKVNRL